MNLGEETWCSQQVDVLYSKDHSDCRTPGGRTEQYGNMCVLTIYSILWVCYILHTQDIIYVEVIEFIEFPLTELWMNSLIIIS